MRTTGVLKAIKGTAGIFLAVFFFLWSCTSFASDISCPVGSYRWGIGTGQGKTAFMNNAVYGSEAEFDAAFDSQVVIGNFCGAVGANTYTYQNRTVTDKAIKAYCYYNGGNGQGFENPSAQLYEECRGTPIPSCSSGASNAFNGKLNGTALASVCYNGCQNNLVSPGGPLSGALVEPGLTIGADTSWHGSYKTTGTACNGATADASAGPPGQLITTTKAIQINPNSKCGTINGEAVCIGTVPNGSCIKTSTGMGVCAVSTAITKAPTPPGPDTGTPGTQATPIGYVQFFKDGQVNTNVFYNSSTMAASTVGAPPGSTTNSTGTGAPGQTQPGATCGGPGQPACTQESNCGVAGKPSCNVKVDESGTPVTTDNLYDKLTGKFDADAASKSVTDAAADSPAKNENANALASLTGLMNVTADCPPLTFDWKGKSYNLLSPDACNAFASFRAIFGFILLVGVTVLLLQRAIEVM